MSILLGGKHYRVNLDSPVSLAIALDFHGSQPSFFGAPRATAAPFKTKGLVGDTQQGSSCNVARLSLIPHCNGTHTESVGHIVHQVVPISEILQQALLPAQLITITPCAGSETLDSYRPVKQADDRLITWALLEDSLKAIDQDQFKAVVVRTLPNDEFKKSRHYGESCRPPFLSVEAVYYLNERGVEHLLVDFPSLDKMHDEGRLTAHHLFWKVPEQHHELALETNTLKTITEMIFVPNHVPDGLYLLDLQIPAFLSDAAPSRPVIYSLEPL